MFTDVLVIGKGAREHALAWKLSQSPRLGRLYVAPGNPGTAQIACNLSDMKVMDIYALARFAKDNVDLTVVGPEDPLAAGIVDVFRANDLPIFGPTPKATHIESSKSFAKHLMKDACIPTADYEVFDNHGRAMLHVCGKGFPLVIKADGFALGKGVYVCQDLGEATVALDELMLRSVHGEAGKRVVIEDYLLGPEVSIHAFCDGHTFSLCPPVQDHKQVFDNNQGPNTGGMGTVKLPWVTPAMMENIGKVVVQPVLTALEKCNKKFSGLLFPGLKMTEGGPKVLEFNARFGDPETQTLMMLLKTDLLDILEACVRGRLSEITIEWHSGFAATVVLASRGYPGKYEAGIPISGLESVRNISDVKVFHAGTELKNGEVVTAGGRVLSVSARADTLQEALDRAYEVEKLIHFHHKHCRRDIGRSALARQLEQQV